jgi:hypothetical protein
MSEAPAFKHKMPEYRTWINMRSRCNTPSSSGFHRYGGRGIRVCDRWNASFEAFLDDMGPRPSPKHSIDRIDVDGNYEPKNCRWATAKQQMRNFSDNRLVEMDGRVVPLVEAVEASGLKYNTILYRLKRGWTLDQARKLAPQRGVKP